MRPNLSYADRDQLRRIFRRFFPQANASLAESFAAALPEHQLAMSAVQNYLIRHADSVEDACDDVESLAVEGHSSPFAPQVDGSAATCAHAPVTIAAAGEWFSVGL